MHEPTEHELRWTDWQATELVGDRFAKHWPVEEWTVEIVEAVTNGPGQVSAKPENKRSNQAGNVEPVKRSNECMAVQILSVMVGWWF